MGYGIAQGDWVKLTREPGFIRLKLDDGRELLRVKEGRPPKEAAAAEPDAEPTDPSALRARPGSWGTLGLDPDVVELCDTYHIDDVHCRKLSDLVSHRKEYKEVDMVRLWQDME